MTIREMIERLQTLAMESENGENTTVQFEDEEWGATDITEMYVTGRDADIVLIVGN